MMTNKERAMYQEMCHRYRYRVSIFNDYGKEKVLHVSYFNYTKKNEKFINDLLDDIHDTQCNYVIVYDLWKKKFL